ncbi:MAG: type 4a pilus biogenesis protein PilO [Candidatus Magnetominusculus sp. LBB02]|nr:type 4a pilus biogenesis protein PilO [Candidatus Magnetominusculus sp. LBB02]
MGLVMPDVNKLHPALKALIALLPAIIIAVPFYMLVYSPNTEQIEKIKVELKKTDDEIATATKRVAKLPTLLAEKKLVEAEYQRIRRYLPEENEITTLLKQVSDNAISSGLKVDLWQPQPKRTHPSNILYEIPVTVKVTGTYHKLGDFLSRITALDRIVNTSQIDLATKTTDKEATLAIGLEARTFSAIPEPEPAKEPAK